MFLCSHSHHSPPGCLSPLPPSAQNYNLDFLFGCLLELVGRVFSEFEEKGLTRWWHESGWRRRRRWWWWLWVGPVSAAAGLDWADGRAGPSYSRYYSVTCRPSPCLLTDSEMTVLEQDKTGPTMSDRYITPEYLAHLPTSVSTDRLTELALSEIPTTHF